MKYFLSGMLRFLRAEEGATAVEYGILIAAIAVTIVAIVIIVGQQIESGLHRICTEIAKVATGSTVNCE